MSADPYAAYRRTPAEPIECAACWFPFEVPCTGLDQSVKCPDCGVFLSLSYDAEQCERGCWHGGYRVRVAQ